ncbi:MAG: hypothetical protein WKG07_17215 [Hymenobacter sp.]
MVGPDVGGCADIGVRARPTGWLVLGARRAVATSGPRWQAVAKLSKRRPSVAERNKRIAVSRPGWLVAGATQSYAGGVARRS